MIMQAKYLLSRHPHPSEDEIKYAIEDNVCRCTGYHKIIEAISAAAANSAGPAQCRRYLSSR